MNAFQALSTAGLLLFMLAELRRPRNQRRPGMRFRLVVACAAMISINWPALPQTLANLAGIDRGADFISYMFIFTFMGTSFYFYSQVRSLERQNTEIVRCLALAGAEDRRPGTAAAMPRSA